MDIQGDHCLVTAGVILYAVENANSKEMKIETITLGSVEIFPETIEVSSKLRPHFRTPEFSQIVLECEEIMKQFANVDKGGKGVFLTCLGIGALEAAVINCFDKKD